MDTRRNKIKWRNIYYMLSYVLEELDNLDIGENDFDACESLDDLLAALMIKAVEILNKNNFMYEYSEDINALYKPRGSILIQESYNKGTYPVGMLYCRYFELSKDSLVNITIKSAINHLINNGRGLRNISITSLKNTVDDLFFVKDESLHEIDFREIEYESLPDWYKPAIVVSRLIERNLIGKDSAGDLMLWDVTDNNRLRIIFESFVREYYKKDYNSGNVLEKTDFNLDGGRKVILDILIEGIESDVALIIDTKWYQGHIGNNRSSNMGQAYDYAGAYKEFGGKNIRNVVVLYAMTGTNADVLNRVEVRHTKNNLVDCTICEKTLDLDRQFEDIKGELTKIADEFINRMCAEG